MDVSLILQIVTLSINVVIVFLGFIAAIRSLSFRCCGKELCSFTAKRDKLTGPLMSDDLLEITSNAQTVNIVK